MFNFKNIKFPLVTRKKLEMALNNNAILNKNRLELSKNNMELQKQIRDVKASYTNEVEDLQKENKKLGVTIKGLTKANEDFVIEKNRLNEIITDRTRDVEHYVEKCELLEKRVKEYERIVNRAKKKVISKHCKKCGRFFRIASIDSYKKYCPKCEQKIKEEKRNGRRK